MVPPPHPHVHLGFFPYRGTIPSLSPPLPFARAHALSVLGALPSRHEPILGQALQVGNRAHAAADRPKNEERPILSLSLLPINPVMDVSADPCAGPPRACLAGRGQPEGVDGHTWGSPCA